MSEKLSAVVKKISFTSTRKKSGKKNSGRIVFKSAHEQWPKSQLKGLTAAQLTQIKNDVPMVSADDKNGPVLFLQSRHLESKDHYGFFSPSPYSMARDLGASGARNLIDNDVDEIIVEFIGDNPEELQGFTVGLEMICYEFSKLWPKTAIKPVAFTFNSKDKKSSGAIAQGQKLGMATNLARFLVDLPPNALNPQTYGDLLADLFPSTSKIKTEVWPVARLQKEKMGLHLAVGQAAEHGPCMVHIAYRHPQCQEPPMAFVGKGITFDSGGLDIKPAAGMRNMKKDMGGSAAVVGIAYWVQLSQPKVNCDFYLAIAENAIAGNSFRPGDILTARNGLTVEIHNTDAEGRLVMADVMALAVERNPSLLIDVATLTGAIKFGLGSATPGLFSNTDNLAELLLRSAQARGEPAWRMPLVPEERGRLKSDVADLVNCTEGFGGAVVAALFLEKFVGKVPWAHIDMYAWTDRGRGPFRKPGGSGQLVQALCEFIISQEK